MSEIPEDSVLRRHYEQLKETSGPGASAATAGGSTTTPASSGQEKGFLGKLLDKLFGN